MRKKRWMVLGCAALAAVTVSGCGAKTETATTAVYEESSSQAGGEETNTSTFMTVKVTSISENTVSAETGEIRAMEMMPGGAPGGAPGEKPDGAPDGAQGEKPEGNAPDGSAPGFEAGERPEGNPPEGAPNGAQGEKPEGNPPEGAPDGTQGERPEGGAPNGAPDGGHGGKPEGGAQGGEHGGKPEGGAQGGAHGGKPEGDAPNGAPGEKPEGGMMGGNAPSGQTFEGSGNSIIFTLSDATAVTLEYLQGSGEGSLKDIVVGSVLEVTLDDNQTAVKVVVKNLNAGNGFGGSGEVTHGDSANTISEDGTITDTTYTSQGDNENALRADGVSVTLDQVTIEKTGGESSNTEDGDFYGQNAAFLALNGATVTISNATVNSFAVNGNGVFSYGEGTTVNISDSVIRTTERNSGGIQTTGGGTTNAQNLDVETQGNSSAAIRSDRGGGTVNVNGGTYVTNGTGSPAIYCTADITVADAALTANASEGVVVEGKNSVTLKNCDLTASMANTYNGDSDENIHGIMIYQSMSGDAEVGEAYFNAEGGSIATTVGDLFYITNTDCEISLKDVALKLANEVLLRIEGNSSSRGWGTQGANGGDVILTADSQKLEGNILVDAISSLNFTMKNNTALTGAINPEGEGGTVNVTLESGSSWNLTGDSYITSFTGDLSDITANGYHLYVDGQQVL